MEYILFTIMISFLQGRILILLLTLNEKRFDPEYLGTTSRDSSCFLKYEHYLGSVKE